MEKLSEERVLWLRICWLGQIVLPAASHAINMRLPPQLCDNHLCDGGHGCSQRPAALEEDGDPQGVCTAPILKAVPLFSCVPGQFPQASPALAQVLGAAK